MDTRVILSFSALLITGSEGRVFVHGIEKPTLSALILCDARMTLSAF